MKLSLSRFLVFAIAAILLNPHASAQEIEIPDANLESAIREALELPDSTAITQQEMLRLERLTAKGAQIENITGLKYASNLKSLVLSVNNISDITPLAELTNLDFLILRNNPITDLSPLANLTKLTYLNLAGVIMEDLAPLSNLTQLRELHAIHCEIKDITAVSNLTQLVWLNVSANRIVDVSPLANLTALEKLQIDRNQVVDVSPLANLTQLTELTIANNAITDFRPLFGLNLQSIDIDIRSLQELASGEVKISDPNLERAIREEMGLPFGTPITRLLMSQLTALKAVHKQIVDLTGLEQATNLRSLDLAANEIRDITPLTGLTHLEVLELRDNPITDLTPLANLTNLTYINLAGVRPSDITALANLTKLKTAHLSHMLLRDITPLANLTQLVRLNLVSNRIVDVSPLTNLTALEELHIEKNNTLDLSPLLNLSLTTFTYDQVCSLPDPPIQDRIENRNLPSIIQGWGDGIADLWDDLPALSHLSYYDRIAYHDIHWHHIPFGLHFQKISPWSTLAGDIDSAIARREELLAKNPNMLFLVEILITYATINSHFPEDWFGWLRDEAGNFVQGPPGSYLIDFRRPEAQDVIVQQVISMAKCGLYDGMIFDSWSEVIITLHDRSLPYDYDEQTHTRLAQQEREARTTILRRIRENVPDDFLILVNSNRYKIPFSIPYINGGFMETFPHHEGGYTRDDIIDIETNLIWYEENAREPQINCLRGLGIGNESPDSPNNRRWMRVFTTMGLTLSDGYVLYTIGTIRGQKNYQKHIWYPFWDANLGQPVGPTAQRYQEDIEGLYIREFTNGWAVYNRSGKAQTITLPSSASSVSDRGNNAASTTHLLPDLDGEIYLTSRSFADVNADGKVNILDLVQVANGFGRSAPDPNGDGTVNILDLIFVAQQFNQ